MRYRILQLISAMNYGVNMYKILIVEDDSELSGLFARVLEKNGYEVSLAVNGSDALKKTEEDYFDLVLSDIMMPETDGYQLISRLRADGNKIPVLIVTAKGSLDDMRKGFNSGSDDYMVKPVNINELLLRIEALIRRFRMMNERKLTIGGTVMELDSLRVTSAGESNILPQKEFMVLYKMASYPGKIFTRQQLLDEIWADGNKSDTHTVDVHIGRLRDRFRNCADFEIVTIRDVGYKLMKK